MISWYVTKHFGTGAIKVELNNFSLFIFWIYFQGVHTIKKSYSLSDLSETDGMTESFRQELMPVRHRVARPKNMSVSNISTRSTSLTKRPTSEIYFPEVEVKDDARRSHGDYRWVYFTIPTEDCKLNSDILVTCTRLMTSVQAIHRRWICHVRNYREHHRTLHCAANAQLAIPWRCHRRCLDVGRARNRKCNEQPNKSNSSKA